LASSSVITGFILMVPSFSGGDDLVGIFCPDKELANPSLQLQPSAPIPSQVSFPIATLSAAGATIVLGDRGR
jgi:hypothetical protein